MHAHCFKYSLLRALLLGSRPGAGFPNAAAVFGAPDQLPTAPAQDCGLLFCPLGSTPFGKPDSDVIDMRFSEGKGTSAQSVTYT